MPVAILGISAYYHDSAAALVLDGEIVAAAQEERFTRKRHDESFPSHAVSYVLKEAGIQPENLEAIVFYEKPFIKFERLLETYHAFAPAGLQSFIHAVPLWIREKLFLRKVLKDEIAKIGKTNAKLLFPEHHLSHAASAFYPSPFDEAAILTLDGVGEWATTTIGKGRGTEIEILRELQFPHSIGLLYSAFTYYTGFRVNSGEYKLMGLAPYGHINSTRTEKYEKCIREELAHIADDGSVSLNMKYFRFTTGLVMTDNPKWQSLFNVPPRKPDDELMQEHMDMALAIQKVTEDIILKIAAYTRKVTGYRNLVMAGGVALNCVANGKLMQSGLFENIWIQPAAGDAGGALGAALAAWHIYLGKPRIAKKPDSMKGSLLGPEFSDREIALVLRKYDAVVRKTDGPDDMCLEVARLINDGNVIGWFQGRMEFGPRALGNRSILADARNRDMQKKLNLKIKYREGFRPFAPSVNIEYAKSYFDLDMPSPYMLLVAPVNMQRWKPEPEGYGSMSLTDRLYHVRSDIPAVTHIDYSARIQTVDPDVNPLYHTLIRYFMELTGYGVIVNTSFNVRGEPIVCNPEDAYRCFMSTEMDYLAIGNYILKKEEQPHSDLWAKGAKEFD